MTVQDRDTMITFLSPSHSPVHTASVCCVPRIRTFCDIKTREPDSIVEILIFFVEQPSLKKPKSRSPNAGAPCHVVSLS